MIPIINFPVNETSRLNKPLPDTLRLETSNYPSFPNESIKIAFYNILTTHVTDKEPKKSTFSKYRWENRKSAVIELIYRDHPHVLGLCELDIRQAKTLEDECRKGGKLEQYHLYGYASETKQTIQDTKNQFHDDEQVKYGEFVAFLIDTTRIQLEKDFCHSLPSCKNQKWKRILVQAHLHDTATKTHFVCLFSHFDHFFLEARQQSAAQEIQIIQQLESKKTPWFSLSDRNWYRDEDGEKGHQQYLQQAFISDFKDDTKLGLFGPPGTFPGHIWLEGQSLSPVVKLKDDHLVIDAPCVSTGYTSKFSVEKLAYYAKTGEYDPSTGKLLPFDLYNDLSLRNLASDHYLIGSVFLFK
jgi:hypothetical protein